MENQQGNADKGYLDLSALSEYSSIGKSTLHTRIKTGDLKAYRIGGKLFEMRELFDRWVEKFAYEPEDLGV